MVVAVVVVAVVRGVSSRYICINSRQSILFIYFPLVNIFVVVLALC